MILSLCEIAALRPPADICAHITDIFTIQADMKHLTYTSNVPQTFSFHHRGKTQTPIHTLALLTAMMPLANRFLLQDL